jgi:hypothetical protein
MDRMFVRTCSADQASILSAAVGRCTRVRSARVRICPPDGRFPIDPDSDLRYLARIEVLDADPVANGAAPEPVSEVISDLFGQYLE